MQQYDLKSLFWSFNKKNMNDNTWFLQLFLTSLIVSHHILIVMYLSRYIWIFPFFFLHCLEYGIGYSYHKLLSNLHVAIKYETFWKNTRHFLSVPCHFKKVLSLLQIFQYLLCLLKVLVIFLTSKQKLKKVKGQKIFREPLILCNFSHYNSNLV